MTDNKNKTNNQNSDPAFQIEMAKQLKPFENAKTLDELNESSNESMKNAIDRLDQIEQELLEGSGVKND